MVKANNRAIVFLKPPTEFPLPGKHLGIESQEVDDKLKENEVLTRNLALSLDPYLRGRMSGQKADYLTWFKPGQTIDSYVVGEGFTAYGSLLELGQPKAGETIFISAASGAVGQLVGQIARRFGLRVIGSAGSDDKVQYLLNELKFDAAFNYKKVNKSILETLRELAGPKGFDIYYDNVGGETLEAAIEVINKHGRIIACGHISDYNSTQPYAVKNLYKIIVKSLKVLGFMVYDFSTEVRVRFEKEVTQWLLNGEIIYKEHVTVGLENTPEAFLGLLQGKNFGKAVVKIADL
ncbi:hypothetical protein BX616_002049 [Lobosporangium transversale]|uniref:Enoyl reductase (ER) domain-containing protein n=1 Tax=Lobosporangium transversale TaxID=64571 RepID=A0A1Y2G6P9_9FUNG|nr:hypothetical protein BCR41DRAFT_390842 [Lobosporangium transversale]KAF9902073.1 hypothetical protein BX616_002049 [Lobosporangium transversale]ORY95130.1 hypothetical protein BCR41DRAFT_390842 [Lobosporangium transversale]|eukprot:XP_021875337.1 hypothetical protein BCR41DRAFT_390842 [Lobosporangium transversale]